MTYNVFSGTLNPTQSTNPITVNPMLLTVTVTVNRLFRQLNWTTSTPATTDLVVYGCLWRTCHLQFILMI